MAEPAQLGAGTVVTLHGLVAKPDLNGVSGRILKFDADTGRYGVRLATGKLVALKPTSLRPQPTTDTNGGGVTDLLHLPADALDYLLSHLSVRALHRLSACCSLLNSTVKACTTIWSSMLAHPLLAPYSPVKSGGAATILDFAAALNVRDKWHSGNWPKTAGSRGILCFSRFARSVAVDFEARVIACGLSSGAVACARIKVDRPYEVDNLEGDTHEEQVLTIAIDVPSGLIISGCGRPAYPVAYPPAPYSATVKVWSVDFTDVSIEATLPGELKHTLEGHEDAVRKVVFLSDKAFAASASADCTLKVWHVGEGRLVRTLARHSSPVVNAAALRVDGQLLSAALDGEIVLWRWRTGQGMRVLNPSGLCGQALGERRRVTYVGDGDEDEDEDEDDDDDEEGLVESLSALSYHAPTATIVVGTTQGRLHLWQLNVDDDDPASAPQDKKDGLTPLIVDYRIRGEEDDGGFPGMLSPERATVVSVQHDADKLVSVARNGDLTCHLVRKEAVAAGRDADPGPYELSPLEPWPPPPAASEVDEEENEGGDDSMNGVTCLFPLEIEMAWRRDVRYYVSTVLYDGGVMVNDGLDDKVLITGGF